MINILLITNEYNKYVVNYLENNNDVIVLFSFINNYNVNLILNKYKNINNYYSFIELLDLIKYENINIIDYYNDNNNYISINNRFFGNKINKYIKKINYDTLFTWEDYINNHKCFFDLMVKEYNYPLEFNIKDRL